MKLFLISLFLFAVLWSSGTCSYRRGNGGRPSVRGRRPQIWRPWSLQCNTDIDGQWGGWKPLSKRCPICSSPLSDIKTVKNVKMFRSCLGRRCNGKNCEGARIKTVNCPALQHVDAVLGDWTTSRRGCLGSPVVSFVYQRVLWFWRPRYVRRRVITRPTCSPLGQTLQGYQYSFRQCEQAKCGGKLCPSSLSPNRFRKEACDLLPCKVPTKSPPTEMKATTPPTQAKTPQPEQETTLPPTQEETPPVQEETPTPEEETATPLIQEETLAPETNSSLPQEETPSPEEVTTTPLILIEETLAPELETTAPTQEETAAPSEETTKSVLATSEIPLAEGTTFPPSEQTTESATLPLVVIIPALTANEEGTTEELPDEDNEILNEEEEETDGEIEEEEEAVRQEEIDEELVDDEVLEFEKEKLSTS